jgi:adenosyl cobinamide kinase/adenosyl cobinamide phosphate guanylyltransferase
MSDVKNIKVKACEVMQYWRYMDCKTIDEIISRIQTLTYLKKWAIITHDKDLLPDGQLKPAHFHCVLTFSNATTIKSIADCIGLEMQYVEKIRTTVKSAFLYLVHRNDPGKYQYSPDAVKASFDYVTYVDDCPVKQKRESIAERIERGEIKQYNLCKHVTIDEYSKNYRYYQRCFEYRQNKLKGLNRNMECIFVTGGSGTGKTTYAKMIASQKGYACYISSGGKNPLDDYQGEECIILDDTRSSTWNLTDFLKLTDNHTDSLVGCRYYNKSIAECKLLIVTSVKTLDEFYEHATKEDNEPKIQLLRRFSMVVEMTLEDMTIKYYDERLARHIPAYKVRNPVSALFVPKVAKKVVTDFVQLMGLEIVEECQPVFMPIEDEEEVRRVREIFGENKEREGND